MLTPKDIETKAFKISIRGYSVSEVDDFLQEICDSYLEIYESNKKLKDDVSRLSDAVGQYKSMEETITGAAKIADKNADGIENDANNRAKLIIENAELTAKSIIAGAQQKVSEETYRLESIKREVEIYKNKIVELLNAQLSVLKGYPQSGSIGIDITPTHSQQMWMKKTEKPVEEVAKPAESIENTIIVEDDEIVEAVEEKTETLETVSEETKKKHYNEFDDTARINLDTDEPVVDTDTDKLPCVKVNEDGEYIIDEK